MLQNLYSGVSYGHYQFIPIILLVFMTSDSSMIIQNIHELKEETYEKNKAEILGHGRTI